MANRYWVGGSGSWTTVATANWSTTSGGSGGASVPTTSDNVIFDQATTYTVTLGSNIRCADLTISAGTVTTTGVGTLDMSGSLSIIAATIWNNSQGLTFTSTTTGKTVTSNGVVFNCQVIFDGVGGGWSLGSSLTTATSSIVTLSNGALNLNGFDINTGGFTSSNTNTRSIAFGANNIYVLSSLAAQQVLSMGTVTNFTWTGTGGFITDAALTRSVGFGLTGGSTTNAVNLTIQGSGTSVITFDSTAWFKNLTFGTTAFTPPASTIHIVTSLTLSSSGTYTSTTLQLRGACTITTNGKTVTAIVINNTTNTATLVGALTVSGDIYLVEGTLDCSTYSLTSGTFTSIGTLTRSITGTGTYTITGAGSFAFNNQSAAGITITGLTISMTAATAKTFVGAGGSFSTLNQGGAGALTISGNNSFADLTATTRPSTITFTASSTQTFTAFTLSGTSGNLVTINSSTSGTQATLSKSSGAVSVSFLSIQDSNATGGATWKATSSTNVSNNSGWTFSTIFYGSTNVTTIYYGSSPVSAIYYGSTRVY